MNKKRFAFEKNWKDCLKIPFASILFFVKKKNEDWVVVRQGLMLKLVSHGISNFLENDQFLFKKK